MNEQPKHTEDPRRFPANAQGFLFAPVVWFVWFVALYSVQGAGCAIGLHEVGFGGLSVLRAVLAALSVAAAAAIAGVGAKSFRSWRRVHDSANRAGGRPVDHAEFLAYGALLNAGLFFLAVAWSTFPLVGGELCESV